MSCTASRAHAYGELCARTAVLLDGRLGPRKTTTLPWHGRLERVGGCQGEQRGEDKRESGGGENAGGDWPSGEELRLGGGS